MIPARSPNSARQAGQSETAKGFLSPLPADLRCGPGLRHGVSGPLLAATGLATLFALGGVAQAQELACTLQDGSCIISTNGADGHNGADGTDTDGARNGVGGTQGSAAGDITTVTIDNLMGLVSSGVAISPINITAFGGTGGDGGNAYPSISQHNFGAPALTAWMVARSTPRSVRTPAAWRRTAPRAY